eukprot:tig00021721_g23207.t1
MDARRAPDAAKASSSGSATANIPRLLQQLRRHPELSLLTEKELSELSFSTARQVLVTLFSKLSPASSVLPGLVADRERDKAAERREGRSADERQANELAFRAVFFRAVAEELKALGVAEAATGQQLLQRRGACHGAMQLLVDHLRRASLLGMASAQAAPSGPGPPPPRPHHLPQSHSFSSSDAPGSRRSLDKPDASTALPSASPKPAAGPSAGAGPLPSPSSRQRPASAPRQVRSPPVCPGPPDAAPARDRLPVPISPGGHSPGPPERAPLGAPRPRLSGAVVPVEAGAGPVRRGAGAGLTMGTLEAGDDEPEGEEDAALCDQLVAEAPAEGRAGAPAAAAAAASGAAGPGRCTRTRPAAPAPPQGPVGLQWGALRTRDELVAEAEGTLAALEERAAAAPTPAPPSPTPPSGPPPPGGGSGTCGGRARRRRRRRSSALPAAFGCAPGAPRFARGVRPAGPGRPSAPHAGQAVLLPPGERAALEPEAMRSLEGRLCGLQAQLSALHAALRPAAPLFLALAPSTCAPPCPAPPAADGGQSRVVEAVERAAGAAARVAADLAALGAVLPPSADLPAAAASAPPARPPRPAPLSAGSVPGLGGRPPQPASTGSATCSGRRRARRTSGRAGRRGCRPAPAPLPSADELVAGARAVAKGKGGGPELEEYLRGCGGVWRRRRGAAGGGGGGGGRGGVPPAGEALELRAQRLSDALELVLAAHRAYVHTGDDNALDAFIASFGSQVPALEEVLRSGAPALREGRRAGRAGR